METFIKILPIIVVVLVVFLVKEGLSIYKYLKYCQLHEAAKTNKIDKVRKLIKEGRLEDLIAIEDQTEIVLRDADPELLAGIEALVKNSAGTSIVRTGKPRTTLERLFLREIREEER